MDAAPVSSTVSRCGPEPSSPSSISHIAVATITHLHLHGAAMRQLRAGVEGGRERLRGAGHGGGGDADYWRSGF